MSKITQAKTIKRRDGLKIAVTLKAGETIYQGGLVMLDGGEAINAKTVANKTTIGVALTYGTAGNVVEVETGIFAFENSSSSDCITKAEIGTDAFVVDNQTVAKTNGSSSRSVAGRVIDVDADGVWVKINK